MSDLVRGALVCGGSSGSDGNSNSDSSNSDSSSSSNSNSSGGGGSLELRRTDRDESTALWQYQEEGGAIGYVGGTDPTALLPANAITHTAVEFMCGAGGHAFGMRKVLNIIGAAESCGHMRASYEASLGVRPKRTVKALASGGLVASVVAPH